MGNEVGNLARTRRSDLGWHVARRTRLAGGVQPDPPPAEGLGQRPVQDDMDPVNGAGGERATLTAAASAEVGVEAVDVLGRELRHREVPEVGFQVVLDEAYRLPSRAGCPIPRRRLEPAIQQLGDAPGVEP